MKDPRVVKQADTEDLKSSDGSTHHEGSIPSSGTKGWTIRNHVLNLMNTLKGIEITQDEYEYLIRFLKDRVRL